MLAMSKYILNSTAAVILAVANLKAANLVKVITVVAILKKTWMGNVFFLLGLREDMVGMV